MLCDAIENPKYEKEILFKQGRLEGNLEGSIEHRRSAMREIRNLLSYVDGSNIDLNQTRAERRSAKYERTA